MTNFVLNYLHKVQSNIEQVRKEAELRGYAKSVHVAELIPLESDLKELRSELSAVDCYFFYCVRSGLVNFVPYYWNLSALNNYLNLLYDVITDILMQALNKTLNISTWFYTFLNARVVGEFDLSDALCYSLVNRTGIEERKTDITNSELCYNFSWSEKYAGSLIFSPSITCWLSSLINKGNKIYFEIEAELNEEDGAPAYFQYASDFKYYCDEVERQILFCISIMQNKLFKANQIFYTLNYSPDDDIEEILVNLIKSGELRKNLELFTYNFSDLS